MSTRPSPRGRLFLVPTPLDFGCDESQPIEDVLPALTLRTAAGLTHWITENAKSTRAFLKRVHAVVPLAEAVQAQQIQELPRQVHKKGDHEAGSGPDVRPLLAAASQGHDIGLLSEAGMPAIADPGASVVRAAHALGLEVRPLVGPVSLMLALAASGLNGQNFAFVGYLPQEAGERAQRVRELESLAHRTGQTQLFIETPYRNAALLQGLLQVLKPQTRLAVCCGMTLGQQVVHSAAASDWKQRPPSLPLALPAIFLIGR
jgi:16S rRNA (cytidine1402-2'-O)-methyltransferase